MKAFVISIIALLISVSAFAQEDFSRNEISVNLGSFLFLYPEISFERLLTEDIGIGTSLGFGLGNGRRNFNFTPFARMYFGNSREGFRFRPGTGFFIEINSSFYSFRYDWWEDFYNEGYWHWGDRQSENRFDIGVGVAIGWKFLSRNNRTGELLLGFGRGAINEYSFYPRVGISFGRRF